MLYITASTIFLVVILFFLIRRFYQIKKHKYLNELVVHKYRNDDIFITRAEVDHFESLDKAEKRRLVNRFQSQVRKGVFVKVYENNKVIGYVRKVN